MTEATRAAIDDIIDAFRCGDHARLADRYDDDIEWQLHAPISVFPFAGIRRGKNAVLASLLGVYRDFQIAGYDIALIMVDGDRAATISDVRVIQRSTGRVIVSHLASFHRFRDGKLIEYRGFSDTFDTAGQALGRELDDWVPQERSISPWMPKPDRG
ncbi:MAG: nuclear transport factor 2 family protein [Proteobacteria bacterium]|nr:nuclear transport factor 2 family protein [Pseudomonadota bacterium]